MGKWLEVAGFGGVCHGPAAGQAGLGGRGQLHGAHSEGGALLLRAQLALVLGQLPVQGYGLGCKQGQLLCAAVPGRGKKSREQFQHRHFTHLPSQQSIYFQACLFLLPNHCDSKQNDQLILAFILTQRTSNAWQKHSGNLETATVLLLLLPWISGYKPRKPPQMSSLISTCSQRMGMWGHSALLLQRTAVPLWLHLWLKERHFWWENHLKSPAADTEIETDVWLRLSGTDNLPSNHLQWGLTCSQ